MRRRAQPIGAATVLLQTKLNFGKADHPAYMIAFAIVTAIAAGRLRASRLN